MKEYRNWTIGMAFFVLCAYLGFVAGPDHVTELGGTFGGASVGAIGIIGARAANKWAEKKNGSNGG